MTVYKIYICDMCGERRTEDEHKASHWTQSFGGPATVDLKSVGNCQIKMDWELLCRTCAHGIVEAVNEFKKTRQSKEPA